ncbi:MAG: Helix-turn-helix domain [Phycisphaerales bacterium]|nr:Helix-turn-helix domain [Phycisphaerales bacterium]
MRGFWNSARVYPLDMTTAPTESDTFMKLSEAARLLRLDRWTLRQIVREGRLRSYRFGKRSFRFRVTDIQEFIASSAVRP